MPVSNVLELIGNNTFKPTFYIQDEHPTKRCKIQFDGFILNENLQYVNKKKLKASLSFFKVWCFYIFTRL